LRCIGRADELIPEFQSADADGEVFDGTDLKPPAQVPHPAGFKLENAEGVCLIKQIVSLGVIQRQAIDRHLNTPCLLDHLTRIPNHGERFQAEEIPSSAIQVADRPHRVLGHDRAFFVLLEGEQIDQRLIADDDAGCVNGSVAREVFQNECRVDQFPRDFLRVISLL